jgi:hypothetical protein
MALCPCCDRASDTIERRRLNTAYDNDAANWLGSCKDCFDAAWAGYEELWKAYYEDRL